MNDNISRQAVLDILKYDVWHDKIEAIEALPSADPWIPCSERLPEKVDEYQRRGWYMTTNAYGSVGETRYEFYDDFKRTGWQSDIQIVAWMPLPKPYKKSNEKPCTVASANVESYGESY